MTNHPDKAREAARIAARFFVGTEAADVAIDAYLAASVPADEKIAEIQNCPACKGTGEGDAGDCPCGECGGSGTRDEIINPLKVSEVLTLVTALSAKLKEVERELND